MKTAGWKKTLTFFWSVLAAHLQKDLPKETPENCRFLNSSLHERFQKTVLKAHLGH